MANDLWVVASDYRAVMWARSFDDLPYRGLVQSYGAPLIVVDYTDHFGYRELITSKHLGCYCRSERYPDWTLDGQRCRGFGECRVHETERERIKRLEADLVPYARDVLPRATAWWPDRGIVPPPQWGREGEVYWPKPEEWKPVVPKVQTQKFDSKEGR